MKKNLSGLLVVTATLMLLSGAQLAYAAADATSGPAFAPRTAKPSAPNMAGIGPGNKLEEKIKEDTKSTADNTENLVEQENEHIDSTRMGHATNAVLAANAAHLTEGLRDRRNRTVEQKRRSNDITERLMIRRARSTADNAEDGGPDSANDAVDENSQVRKVSQETMDDAKNGLLKDPEACYGTNCQMKKLREQENRDLLGIQNVADLFRNGCNELGICDMMAKYITSVKGTVLADVGVATKKNMATLIAAGGGDDYTGAALNLCKLNRNNNELSGGGKGVKATILAGVVGGLVPNEYHVDLYTGDKANSLDGMQADLFRLAAKDRLTQSFSSTVDTVKDSFSRVGGCDAQQAFNKGVKETGKTGTKDGKCSTNNELRDNVLPANQKLARRDNGANPGGGNQDVKQSRAQGRLNATAGAVLSNPSGSCARGVAGGSGATAVSSLFENPKFLALLRSKEFLVAYIDAPKEGEGSFFDSVNIMIANAWQKYEGNGAFMYANLMLNKPQMYASNATKYASLFKFEPMPYEKGNMIAMKEHEKTDPDYNFYAQRIEKDPPTRVANLDAPMPAPAAVASAPAPQVVATKELPIIDMSNITLQELFQKVGVTANPEGVVAIPASGTVTPVVAPKADELRVEINPPVPELKAIFVSTAAIAH